jgi:predicted RNase H-like nuclease
MGIDGSRRGWISASREVDSHDPPALRWFETLAEAFAFAESSGVVHCAIDMPIGLPRLASPGGRPCDRAARSLLPSARKSSIFSVPCAAVLVATSHAEASALNAASAPGAPKISIQTWNILPKIAELDRLMDAARQASVRECHPELVFQELNGGASLLWGKKLPAGAEERRRLLERFFGPLDSEAAQGFHRPHVSPDDILDALACCAAALRRHRGTAKTLGGDPGPRGLRMEICF